MTLGASMFIHGENISFIVTESVKMDTFWARKIIIRSIDAAGNVCEHEMHLLSQHPVPGEDKNSRTRL